MINIEFEEYKKISKEVFQKIDALPDLDEVTKKYTLATKFLIENASIRDGYIILDVAEQNQKEIVENYFDSCTEYARTLYIHHHVFGLSLFTNASSIIEDMEYLRELLKNIDIREFTIVDKDILFNKEQAGISLNTINDYFECLGDNITRAIFDIMKKTKNDWSKDCIHKRRLENSLIEDFLDKTFSEDINLLMNLQSEYNNQNREEAYTKFKENRELLAHNVKYLHIANEKIYSMDEKNYKSIINSINKLEEKYGMKIVLNSGSCFKFNIEEKISENDIENINSESIIKSLIKVNIQGVITSITDKSMRKSMEIVPVIYGDYLYYKACAQLISYKDLPIDESAGICLFKDFKMDHTILTHELEHFKDLYPLKKIKELLNNSKLSKNKKILFEQKLEPFYYLSEAYIKNLLIKLNGENSLLGDIDSPLLEKALNLSFKKQSIYLFNKSNVDEDDLRYKDNKYLHLKEKVTDLIAQTLNDKLLNNISLLIGKEKAKILHDLFDGNNNQYRNELKNKTISKINSSIISDIFIHEIINNKDKRIYTNFIPSINDVNQLGLLGDIQSQHINIKQLMLLSIDLLKEIKEKVPNVNLNDEKDEKDSIYIAKVVDSMFSLKSNINIRLLINEYESLSIPKHYLAYEYENEVLSSIIDSSCVNNSVNRMNKIMDENKKSYINLPYEIYARNAQVFAGKNFLETNRFIKAANLKVVDIVKRNTREMFATNNHEKNKGNKRERAEFNKYNIQLDEMSELMHNEWQDINKELSELIFTNDYSIKVKSKAKKKMI